MLFQAPQTGEKELFQCEDELSAGQLEIQTGSSEHSVAKGKLQSVRIISFFFQITELLSLAAGRIQNDWDQTPST